MAFGVLLLDQAVKYLIVHFKPELVTRNTGAGFGLLQGQAVLLTIISLGVAVGVIALHRRIENRQWPQFLWGLFLGGVVGNLIDRMAHSYVIDFIDLGFWPAFNVADAAISIAAIGLVVWYWKKKSYHGHAS